jgi:hypothetical protein
VNPLRPNQPGINRDIQQAIASDRQQFQTGLVKGTGKIQIGQTGSSNEAPPIGRAAAKVATGLFQDLNSVDSGRVRGPSASEQFQNNIPSLPRRSDAIVPSEINREAFESNVPSLPRRSYALIPGQAKQLNAPQNNRPTATHINHRRAMLTENQQATQRIANLSTPANKGLRKSPPTLFALGASQSSQSSSVGLPARSSGSRPTSQLPTKKMSSIDAAIVKEFSNQKNSPATSSVGNTSNISDLNVAVPGFPNLYRGSAPADGDCLFHSLIQLAGPSVAKAMGVPIETLNPHSVRKHMAAQLMSDFQLFNHHVLNSDHLEVLTALEYVPNESPGDVDLSSLSNEDLVSLLGSTKRVEQFGELTLNQQAHVIRVATPRQFVGVTADTMPKLIADAFSDLKVVVHQPSDSADSVEKHSTFSTQSAETQHTVRLFLEDEHYEPVFEGPPR